MTLTVSGDVDLSTADDLERQFAAHLAGDATVVDVDLSGVPFVDSAGINVLLKARRDAQLTSSKG